MSEQNRDNTLVDFNQLVSALMSFALLAFTVKAAKTPDDKIDICSRTKTALGVSTASRTDALNMLDTGHSTVPRPGWTIKRALSAEIPVCGSVYTFQASILDLYKTYCRQIEEENQKRFALHKSDRYMLKGMKLASFKTLFKFARYLELVRLVPEYKRTKKMSKIGIYGLYELTDKGRADNSSWDDLCGAWRKREKNDYKYSIYVKKSL